ncbi:hypothetical protein ACFE04_012643 [Oxalis oulophora]
MEKIQQKNKILRLLPAKPHRHPSTAGFFSGPLVNVPDGRKKKNKPNNNNNNIFETDNSTIDHYEPTSPKISCMGQIKDKKKQIKKCAQERNHRRIESANNKSMEKVGTSSFKLKRFLSGLKSRSDHVNNDISVKDEMPSLSQMKRFTSGRDAFANFDWMAQVVPDQDEDCINDDEIIIPFSAPMLRADYDHKIDEGMDYLQPKKEINLWKRRTMDPPRPLQRDAEQRVVSVGDKHGRAEPADESWSVVGCLVKKDVAGCLVRDIWPAALRKGGAGCLKKGGRLLGARNIRKAGLGGEDDTAGTECNTRNGKKWASLCWGVAGHVCLWLRSVGGNAERRRGSWSQLVGRASRAVA